MAAPRKVRREPVAFEDRTTPDQRVYGVYLIKAPGTGYAETYTGPYRNARKLARSRTRFGDIELVFIEPHETPAID